MATVSAYWRPAEIDDALKLLSRPHAVALGGGTRVNATATEDPVEVVDLQALGLGGIERIDSRTLRIGATTTLQQLSTATEVPECIRDAARRELPSTLRAQSTVAGTVLTRDRDSELLAALLVHDTKVDIRHPTGVARVALPDLLADRAQPHGGIVIALTMDPVGPNSSARTGRTRADRPIVAAVARRDGDGVTHLALTGVASTPVLVTAVEDVDPPSDFRGSKAYRRALAVTLTRRVLEGLG